MSNNGYLLGRISRAVKERSAAESAAIDTLRDNEVLVSQRDKHYESSVRMHQERDQWKNLASELFCDFNFLQHKIDQFVRDNPGVDCTKLTTPLGEQHKQLKNPSAALNFSIKVSKQLGHFPEDFYKMLKPPKWK